MEPKQLIEVAPVGEGGGFESCPGHADKSVNNEEIQMMVEDVLKRPIEGMSADSMPAVRVLAATDQVWIRL